MDNTKDLAKPSNSLMSTYVLSHSICSSFHSNQRETEKIEPQRRYSTYKRVPCIVYNDKKC